MFVGGRVAAFAVYQHMYLVLKSEDASANVRKLSQGVVCANGGKVDETNALFIMRQTNR